MNRGNDCREDGVRFGMAADGCVRVNSSLSFLKSIERMWILVSIGDWPFLNKESFIGA